VSRVHCLDCAADVVVDPRGFCPSGHQLGTSGARVAEAIGSDVPHPDEPEPWVGRIEPEEVAEVAAPAPRAPVPQAAPGLPQAAPPPIDTQDLFAELGALGDLGDETPATMNGHTPAPSATPAPGVTPIASSNGNGRSSGDGQASGDGRPQVSGDGRPQGSTDGHALGGTASPDLRELSEALSWTSAPGASDVPTPPTPSAPMTERDVAASRQAHDPEPSEPHAPEPWQAHDPEPSEPHAPEPWQAHDPEPSEPHAPEPWRAHDPEPTWLHDAEPTPLHDPELAQLHAPEPWQAPPAPQAPPAAASTPAPSLEPAPAPSLDLPAASARSSEPVPGPTPVRTSPEPLPPNAPAGGDEARDALSEISALEAAVRSLTDAPADVADPAPPTSPVAPPASHVARAASHVARAPVAAPSPEPRPTVAAQQPPPPAPPLPPSGPQGAEDHELRLAAFADVASLGATGAVSEASEDPDAHHGDGVPDVDQAVFEEPQAAGAEGRPTVGIDTMNFTAKGGRMRRSDQRKRRLFGR
jgi:hypothetical protein